MCSDPNLVLKEFRAECAKSTANVRWNKSLSKEAEKFNLNTRDEILKFISGKKIEPLMLEAIGSYRDPGGANQGKPVYGFTFKTSSRDGYLAFFKAVTGTWIIKSFHEPQLSIDRDVMTLAMKQAGIPEKGF